MISAMFASLLIMALCFTVNNSYAQTAKATTMKDCCMMKDGKMMQMKGGKMMPMSKNMTMKNGTKCMMNGECKMKNGKMMMMKEGECMDMKGKMSDCAMMMNHPKTSTENSEKPKAVIYTCPMHPEVQMPKPGNCPKCEMTLVLKK